MQEILEERRDQIIEKGKDAHEIVCEQESLAGAISQRACVFCGARVTLYPIVDALHIVHGAIGCAAYTWDIRGALSSGPELHRLSISTNLNETDVIHGGEKKLYHSLIELIDHYAPKACFIYATCLIGVIGDDVEAVSRRVSQEKGIPVIPVSSEGFKGTKKDGYKAANDALGRLIGETENVEKKKNSINILGDYNIAGEIWIIKEYYERMGIEVVASLTGDGRIEDIQKCRGAMLNIVQCSGSMTNLARFMDEKFDVPYINVSFFGIEDMSEALYEVARRFNDETIMENTKNLVKEEIGRIMPELKKYREKMKGKRAGIYVGGAFKAVSLIKALRHIGISTVVVGSQTGNKNDYQIIQETCDEGTVIVDDTNPLELMKYLREKNVDILIGGVKERPIAFKMGIGFCDHNHERKEPLAGYIGMLNFAKEVYRTISSPVWKFAPKMIP